MDEDKRDLAFGAWHRGEEPDDLYDSMTVFARVMRIGEEGESRWIQDLESVTEQMRIPLPRFEWPPVQIPSRPPGL